MKLRTLLLIVIIILGIGGIFLVIKTANPAATKNQQIKQEITKPADNITDEELVIDEIDNELRLLMVEDNLKDSDFTQNLE